MTVPVMVCGDDISIIINKNNLTITSFFHDDIVVIDCYLFFTCIFSLFFSFVEHLISRQAMLYICLRNEILNFKNQLSYCP